MNHFTGGSAANPDEGPDRRFQGGEFATGYSSQQRAFQGVRCLALTRSSCLPNAIPLPSRPQSCLAFHSRADQAFGFPPFSNPAVLVDIQELTFPE
ncbi:hypothetical protein GJAV_G00060320 [Gymnothorax javanicus]|nr:hypothetical protein GJAV_G00060320 [Gymnothorax javanicus]